MSRRARVDRAAVAIRTVDRAAVAMRTVDRAAVAIRTAIGALGAVGAVGAAGALLGCAAIRQGRYETQAAFDAGWRVAEVVDVARADRITQPVSHDCRGAGPALAPDTPYALLRFADGSRHHRSWATVVVPDPGFVEKGEVVYVDVSDCAAALVRRNARS